MANRNSRQVRKCCICWLIVIAALIVVTEFPSVATAQSSSFGYSLEGFTDSADFIFYLNEEVLVRSTAVWRADMSVSSRYTLTAGGQSIETTLDLISDSSGYWTNIKMNTARGPVTVKRENDTAVISTSQGTTTTLLKPGTVLYENFTPVLLSQAVLAYDQAAGGKQTFPLFIIPATVMDASLERLDTVERSVAGRFSRFTRYRYGLPGVDVFLWVDDGNRVCLGEVPAQHGRYVRNGYESLALRPVQDSLLSQPRFDVIVDSNVWIPMMDGIKLATDIYKPDTAGAFPVVLVRTPYGRKMNDLQARYFARRGYVYAVQDCRGRFGSEGIWQPFFHEPSDGYETIEWLASQPFANGKVGMIGGSYLGWVQWWAASKRPPHLTTIIPNVSPPDPFYNIPYEYGAFFVLGSIWWADVLEQEATIDLSGQKFRDINKKEYRKLLLHLPVIELDSLVLGKRNQYWRDWIDHPNNGDYWKPVNFLDRLDSVNIPVYHQSGWFDGDGIGTKLNYLAMASYGHPYQKLILGPWGHSDQATRSGPNDVDFGAAAIVDLPTSYLRWLDHWLLGIDNGIDKEPLVSLFVMGENKWLYGDRYPLPETKFTPLYLAGPGTANSSHGDGLLTFELPSAAPTDTFTYDPSDPTPDPTFYYDMEECENDADSGEAVVSVEDTRARHRAFYESIDSERNDILVYETPPLTDSLTFVGPVSAVLYGASSARDTDWFMRLAMIDETEQVFPLVHGVLRARFRTSTKTPELLEPGEIYKYQIDMWQTGITVPPGARLRVEVASAAFPTFSRNLNTGGDNEKETESVTANQTIYHDKAHPSHVLLPVIPR